MKRFRLKISSIATSIFFVLLLFFSVTAQSRDQNFPTPVTTNEISGTIKARDIGDSRLTSYYYAFDGGQGDIFINVVTKNFSGDIDVFTLEALRPLTKMVIYADAGVSETGRLIYLRKGERLILRIEGRSPNDDPASFRIKFAGSFIALARQKGVEPPVIESSAESEESQIKVNSVGTIIEILPKPQAPVKEVKTESDTSAAVKDKKNDVTDTGKESITSADNKTEKKMAVVVEDTMPVIVEDKMPRRAAEPPFKTLIKSKPKTKSTARASSKSPPKPPVMSEEKKPDPLASIRLVIQLKDGSMIERPMNEVLKFSVDKGVLTIIAKDGSISRHSIFDVAKVTIE